MPINHIAFDVDGTLVDTERLLIDTLARALEAVCGLAFPRETLHDAAIGRTESYTMERLDVPADKRSEVVRLWNELTQESRGAEPEIYEGIACMLDELDRQGISYGIVTTRDRHLLDYDLGKAGLLERFSPIVTAENTESHKPEPDPLLAYLELAGADAAHTLYVGDTVSDIRCAVSAGVPFALARWGARIGAAPAAPVVLHDPMEVVQFAAGA